MSLTAVPWLLLFWVMQVGANILFKFGTTASGRYWIGFLAGNALGASSIMVLMKIYRHLQVNTAMALGGGGTFLLVQFAMLLAFRERLSWLQYAGVATVAVGMIIVSLGTSAARIPS